MNRSTHKVLLVLLMTVLISTGCEVTSNIEEVESQSGLLEPNGASEAILPEVGMTTDLAEPSSLDALRTRVTKVFNEMIRDREVWEAVALLLSQGGSDNDLLEVANFTIKDDLIMGFTRLENGQIGGVSLMSIFGDNYVNSFPELENDLVNLNSILPGLRFNFPEEALTDHEKWVNAGYPLTSSSYDANILDDISREQAINLIGQEAVDQLDEFANVGSQEYTLYKNQSPASDGDITLAVLKMDESEGAITNGAIFSRTSEEETVQALSITSDENGNFEALLGEEELVNIQPTNHTPYYYVPIPTPCTWQLCSELFSSNTLTNYQQLAEENCQTFTLCFACCDTPNAVGPSYYTIRFEPTSIRCAKTHPYLTVLSQLTVDEPI